MKFDLAGNLITWWERDEVITAASGIAITSQDEVIVADHFGGQMQTYTLDGELLATWAVGELWDPGVVEIDRNDRVYVADVGHSAIRIREFPCLAAVDRAKSREVKFDGYRTILVKLPE